MIKYGGRRSREHRQIRLNLSIHRRVDGTASSLLIFILQGRVGYYPQSARPAHIRQEHGGWARVIASAGAGLREVDKFHDFITGDPSCRSWRFDPGVSPNVHMSEDSMV